MQRKFFTTVLLVATIFLSSNLFSQCDSIKYSWDFEFVDGIYTSFEEFKENKPLIKEEAIVMDNPEIKFQVSSFAEDGKINYYDSTGNTQKLKRSEVWGFCSNNTIYVLYNYEYYRIVRIGSIILFAESTSLIVTTNRISPISQFNKPINYIQYMIDHRTGKVMRYNIKNFVSLLKQDKELYDEFISIQSKQEKKTQMFIYLNRFNEKKPIYFSIN